MDIKKTINKIEQLPKWYGIAIVLICSLLLAELFSTINYLVFADDLKDSMISSFFKISYGVTVLSGIVIWIVSAVLFHLTALLFNGKTLFSRFLFISSYPNIIIVFMILASFLLIDSIQITTTENIMTTLQQNQSFKLAINLVNYSFIPYYIMIIIIIHYVYNIKYLYSILSVIIPASFTWLITEFFKWVQII